MPQEFLASFAVDIDEGGVNRLERILENNRDAERLYRREGFRATGRRNAITDGLDEIELALAAAPA